MVGLPEGKSKEFIEGFVNTLRQIIVSKSWNYDRLPRWLKNARIRFGWINDTLIAVFESVTDKDEYNYLGKVFSDIAILLDVEDFSPTSWNLMANDANGIIMIIGEDHGTIFNIIGEYPALFNCGYAGHHGPIALLNLMIERSNTIQSEPDSIRFIEFAIYVHRREVENIDTFWSFCKDRIIQVLESIYNSEVGDYYESYKIKVKTFEVMTKSGIIVLGKDTGPELQESIQVRDYLNSKGYDANLIKDLPDIPMWSNEDKVRALTKACRFCVMVDRTPSGHIAEYEF